MPVNPVPTCCTRGFWKSAVPVRPEQNVMKKSISDMVAVNSYSVGHLHAVRGHWYRRRHESRGLNVEWLRKSDVIWSMTTRRYRLNKRTYTDVLNANRPAETQKQGWTEKTRVGRAGVPDFCGILKSILYPQTAEQWKRYTRDTCPDEKSTKNLTFSTIPLDFLSDRTPCNRHL